MDLILLRVNFYINIHTIFQINTYIEFDSPKKGLPRWHLLLGPTIKKSVILLWIAIEQYANLPVVEGLMLEAFRAHLHKCIERNCTKIIE